ncbi:MAG: ABC transporter substrate-binding protein [Streptosporangiaceae bacterium]
MRRLLRRRSLAGLAAAATICGGLAACSSSPTAGQTNSGNTPTLVMESSPETSITQAFNPFVATQAAYGMGATGLIYEPLIEFNLAKPPQFYPWLATKYAWGNGGKQITFTIRTGVKWSNGKPLTPADVAFTFNMMKKNSAINLGGLDISSVSTSGNDVTVTFPTAQYTNLQQIAGIAVVPQSIWGKVKNPATFVNPNPVGTGPFKLLNFTPQGFTLQRNPGYWQASKLHVDKVFFPVYTSNTGALSALFSGQIDWTGNFIPGLQKNFVNTNPKYHHFWEAPGGTNSLMPNLNKWPTNQLPVRKAISLAIDRTLIATEGEAGLENPVLNSTGLTLPLYEAWSDPVKALTNSAKAEPAQAKAVLKAAGYTLNSGGFFEKNGKVVQITITDPSAYTDYAQDDALVAQELRAAGIDARFQGQAVDTWAADVAAGNFQLTMHWSNGGITPFNMYNGWLNSSLATGKSATGDYGRLKEPSIDSALGKLAGSTTVAEQTSALEPIAKYVAANLPIIPTTTASQWFEYNSQHFVGWPTEQNPYETGQPSGTNNGPGSGTDLVVILHLRPR